jgi:hypothetical protein
MTLETRQKIANALFAYAQNRGYRPGKKGPKSTYTAKDCAEEFGVTKNTTAFLLAGKDEYLKQVGADNYVKIRMRLYDMMVIDEDIAIESVTLWTMPSKHEKKRTHIVHDGPEKGKKMPKDPGAGDIEKVGSPPVIGSKSDKRELRDTEVDIIKAVTGATEEEIRAEFDSDVQMSDMEVRKVNTSEKANKLRPELTNEVHNSNRILQMDGRVKEVKDMAQNYRNHYRDQTLACYDVYQDQLQLQGKELPDPFILDIFKERLAYIQFLDLIIEKLDNV